MLKTKIFRWAALAAGPQLGGAFATNPKHLPPPTLPLQQSARPTRPPPPPEEAGPPATLSVSDRRHHRRPDLRVVDRRVPLRCRDRRGPEQHLNGTQVAGAAVGTGGSPGVRRGGLR